MLPFSIISQLTVIPFVPRSQTLITTVGSTSFTVPEDVTSISACVISPGNSSGAGGGLSWSSKIDVTPGEILTIVIQAVNPAANAESGIYRGSTKLLVSTAGNSTTGGKGGSLYNSVNEGGGNGGNGQISGGAILGGGAAGYTGNGGNGDTSGTLATDGSGGGGGGGCFTGTPFNSSGTGGGTGIIKAGANGAHGAGSSIAGKPGSGGSGKTYGGGGAKWDTTVTAAGAGAVRIISGNGRTYPNDSADV